MQFIAKLQSGNNYAADAENDGLDKYSIDNSTAELKYSLSSRKKYQRDRRQQNDEISQVLIYDYLIISNATKKLPVLKSR
jgi:hypothetical protein